MIPSIAWVEYCRRRKASGNGAIHNLQHATTSQELVTSRERCRLDPGGIAIHQEGGWFRWARARSPGIAITVSLLPRSSAASQQRPGFFFQVMELLAGFESASTALAVQLNSRSSIELTLSVDKGLETWAQRASSIAFERPHNSGEHGRLLVRMPGHDGGEGAGQSAALVGIVRQNRSS